MKTPVVSVVIAFLNEERFLEEAIGSVLQQTYTDWELILVDDGSTDNSSQIAKEYANKYPGTIRYLEHANHLNKGLSASRNHAIKHAQGDLIAILDADDVWLPHKLSNQVAIFNQDLSVSMLIEASLYWFSWSNPDNDNVLIPIGTLPDKTYTPFELLFNLYPLGVGAAPCPSGWMIRKDVFDRVGFFEESFTKDYQLYEDQAFLSKVYIHEKVHVSSGCNNWYRQRPTSIVHQVKGKGSYHLVRKYFLEWLSGYVNQKHIYNPQLRSLINRNLLPYRYPVYYSFKTAPHKALNRIRSLRLMQIKTYLKQLF